MDKSIYSNVNVTSVLILIVSPFCQCIFNVLYVHVVNFHVNHTILTQKLTSVPGAIR